MKWIFLILLIVFEFTADVFAKEFGIKGKYWIAGIALVFYVLGNAAWLVSLRQGSLLSVGATIFSISTALLAFFVGHYLYKEELSPMQIVGILLSVVSMVFLFWDDIFKAV